MPTATAISYPRLQRAHADSRSMATIELGTEPLENSVVIGLMLARTIVNSIVKGTELTSNLSYHF
jgi:hypothetical protein